MENEDELDEEAILKKAQEMSLEEAPNKIEKDLMDDPDFLDDLLEDKLGEDDKQTLLKEVKDKKKEDKDKKEDK